ncbi:MAG: hypothetical protein WCY71_02990 [Halothiobacillaceae bacterium]
MTERENPRCPGRIDADWKNRRTSFPDAPMPGPETFQALGEAKIRRIIERQHNELWSSPSGRLFGDEEHFRQVVTHAADYFVEILGGPARYIPQRGRPMLRVRHRPFGVTAVDREIWLRALARAMAAEAVPQSVAETIWAWVEPLSMRMIQQLPDPETLSRPGLEQMGFTVDPDTPATKNVAPGNTASENTV